jgi:hypothetical protein
VIYFLYDAAKLCSIPHVNGMHWVIEHAKNALYRPLHVFNMYLNITFNVQSQRCSLKARI